MSTGLEEAMIRYSHSDRSTLGIHSQFSSPRGSVDGENLPAGCRHIFPKLRFAVLADSVVFAT